MSPFTIFQPDVLVRRANVGIPEGNSLVSPEDSDFSHSQDLSAQQYLPRPEKTVQQKSQARLSLADEDDDEDVEAQAVGGANRSGPSGCITPDCVY